MPSKKAHAIALALQGHKVFPLDPNGKTPAHEGSWRRTASANPQRVGEMWTCPVTDAELDYNIGIALEQDVLVFDEDTRDGKQGAKSRELLEAVYEELPPTRTVKSASGGIHRYFKTSIPVSNSASKVGQNIDIKSEGGYVVGPGSTIDGNAYEIIDASPLTDAPGWLTTLAGKPRPEKKATQEPLIDLDSKDAIERATLYLKNKAPDSGTFTIAAKLKDFGISQETCSALMLEHWRDARNLDKDDSHIEFRVANAYRYGQNPIGIAAAEAEFDPVEIDNKPTKRRGINLHNIVSFEWTTKQNYLVQGLLNYRMLAMMSGPSNAGKSPLALDMAAHVALGRPWRGRKVKPSYVLHFSTEGFTGLGNRMEALRREHFKGVETVPLDFVSGSLDLRTSANDAKAIIETVLERSARFGVPAGLVVIDTLSHALGGGDESNPEHVRSLLKNCSEIAGRTGAAVVVLHHPTKDASSDYRGSSIMLNDIDLLVKVDIDPKTKRRTVTTPRVKEFAEIDPMGFHIKVVELGTDSEGDKITSVVVDWIDPAEMEFEAKLTPPQQEVFDVLTGLMVAKQADENATNRTSATFKEWAEALKTIRTSKGKRSGENQALDRALPVLLENGIVVKTKDNQYVIPASV